MYLINNITAVNLKIKIKNKKKKGNCSYTYLNFPSAGYHFYRFNTIYVFHFQKKEIIPVFLCFIIPISFSFSFSSHTAIANIDFSLK